MATGGLHYLHDRDQPPMPSRGFLDDNDQSARPGLRPTSQGMPWKRVVGAGFRPAIGATAAFPSIGGLLLSFLLLDFLDLNRPT